MGLIWFSAEGSGSSHANPGVCAGTAKLSKPLYPLGQALLPGHLFTPVVPDCSSTWGPRLAAPLTAKGKPHSSLRRNRLPPVSLSAERGSSGSRGREQAGPPNYQAQ